MKCILDNCDININIILVVKILHLEQYFWYLFENINVTIKE